MSVSSILSFVIWYILSVFSYVTSSSCFGVSSRNMSQSCSGVRSFGRSKVNGTAVMPSSSVWTRETRYESVSFDTSTFQSDKSLPNIGTKLTSAHTPHSGR